jgi:LmbE family N-acetylglucosaminyl deacetylase
MNKNYDKRILVVAAHPDDEVLGCGATIAKEAARGADVRIVIMQDGITVRYKRITQKAKRELKQLYRDAVDAGEILGVPRKNIMFGKFPCSALNTVPFGILRKYLTDIVQGFKPDAVYTHHHGDYNPDHTAVNEAVLFASRPSPGEHIAREVYTFEVPSSTEWADQSKSPFMPNVFVDVKGTIDKKIRAMEAYTTEIRNYPHPRSPAALRVVAQNRGIQAGLHYAEAFHQVRAIRE